MFARLFLLTLALLYVHADEFQISSLSIEGTGSISSSSPDLLLSSSSSDELILLSSSSSDELILLSSSNPSETLLSSSTLLLSSSSTSELSTSEPSSSTLLLSSSSTSELSTSEPSSEPSTSESSSSNVLTSSSSSSSTLLPSSSSTSEPSSSNVLTSSSSSSTVTAAEVAFRVNFNFDFEVNDANQVEIENDLTVSLAIALATASSNEELVIDYRQWIPSIRCSVGPTYSLNSRRLLSVGQYGALVQFVVVPLIWSIDGNVAQVNAQISTQATNNVLIAIRVGSFDTQLVGVQYPIGQTIVTSYTAFDTSSYASSIVSSIDSSTGLLSISSSALMTYESSTGSNDTVESSGLSNGAIAAIVVVLFVVVFIPIVILVMYGIRHYIASKDRRSRQETTVEFGVIQKVRVDNKQTDTVNPLDHV